MQIIFVIPKSERVF